MQFCICVVSAAPVRKEAAHRSEMISQLLFGETLEILEEKDEWFKVKSTYDNYEGWLTHHLVQPIDEATATAPQPYVTTGLLNPLTLPNGLLNLPMGSTLTGYNEETRLLWDDLHKYHGTFRNTTNAFKEDLLWKTIQPWLNAPYLWGGRTFMGVDCSGFVQVVFKVLGIPMQRDAYQQATEGSPVEDIAHAKTGDVAFFQNENGRITHVGIVLGGDTIVHASGKVRVDTLTADGIFAEEIKKRTHHLHSVKRFI